MAWTDDLVNWLADEGVSIGVWLLIGIGSLIGWAIVCSILIKGMTLSSIKARETVLRSKFAMKQGARGSTKFLIKSAKKAGKMAVAPLHVKDKSVDVDTEIITNNDDDDDHKDDNDNQIAMDIESGLGTPSDASSKKSHSFTEDLSHIQVTDEEKHAFEQRSLTIGNVVRSIGNFTIIAFTAISIMDVLGIPTSTLLGFAALLGLAIALSIQTIAGDFAAGLFILSENQYFVGENVIINDLEGEVEDLSLRTTTIRSEDGYLHRIPNGEIRVVTNTSRDYNMAEVIITLPYTTEEEYESQVEELSNVIPNEIYRDKDLVNAKKIIYQTCHIINIEAFGDDSISLRYSAKVKPGEIESVRDIMIKHIRIKYPKSSVVPLEDDDESGTSRRTYFASKRTQQARSNSSAVVAAGYVGKTFMD